jgi:hypothetical protein
MGVELVVRVVSAIASVAIGLAAILALVTNPGNGVTDSPGEVPSVAYLTLELLCAAFAGLIGASRNSRPLIGAAGGLTLPFGLAGSLMVVPAVILLVACGIAPTSRRTERREIVTGLLVVLLGLSIFIVPALLASPGCWVSTNTPSGALVEVVRGVPNDLGPGQTVIGCAEKMPPTFGFPIAIGFALAALGVAAGLAHQVFRKLVQPPRPAIPR